MSFDGFPSLAEQGKTNVKVLTAYVVEPKIERTKQVTVSRPVYRFVFMHFSSKLKKIEANCGGISLAKILT